MKGSFAVFLFSLFLLSAFCLADTPKEVAERYVAFSQKNSLSLKEFSFEGKAYFLAFLDENESFVIWRDGSSYLLLSDEGVLESVLGNYVIERFEGLFNSSDKAVLLKNFDDFESNFTFCKNASDEFLKNTVLVYYILQIDDRGSTVQYSQNAVDRLRGNESVNASALIVLQGISKAKAHLDSLDLSKGPFSVKEKLGAINDSLTEVLPVALQYEEDFGLLSSRHPEMFNKKTCSFSDELMLVFESLKAVNEIKTASELARALSDSAFEHAESLKIRNRVYNRTSDYFFLRGRFKGIQEKFVATASVSLLHLKRDVDGIQYLMDQLRDSTSLSSAREIEGRIDVLFENTGGQLDYLEGVFPSVSEAVVALEKAKSVSPEEVVLLEEELLWYEQDIDEGRMVEKSNFDSLASRAEELSAAPFPTEFFAGAVLLLLGAVLFYKKGFLKKGM